MPQALDDRSRIFKRRSQYGEGRLCPLRIITQFSRIFDTFLTLGDLHRSAISVLLFSEARLKRTRSSEKIDLSRSSFALRVASVTQI
jgi:hypothetical protein